MKADGKVLLVRLYEKTSASGNRYFAGRLGAAKVAMFLDARAEGPDPCWELFVQSGDDGHAQPRQAPVQASARATTGTPTTNINGARKRTRRELPDPIKAAVGWAVPNDPL